MDVNTALKEWGLDEKEAKVYLFLLRKGLSAVNSISKETGILRQTIYEVVNKLEHKGLIGGIMKDNKAYFEASNPEKLITLLKDKEETINEILPSLRSLQKIASISSEVKVFKGLKGAKLLLTDCLKGRKEIRTIQPIYAEAFMKEFFIENFLIKRVGLKIPIKILREDTKSEYHKRLVTNKKEFREVRILKELKDFKAHFITYGDKLVMLAYRDEPIGVMIKDEFITTSFKILYDVLWEKGKPIY